MQVLDENSVFIALIGDIRGSRQLDDRAGVQRRLEQALEDVGGTVRERLPFASDLVITTGDEFQGLFYEADAPWEIAVRLTEELASHGIPLRFGLGIGPLDTEPKPQAIGMDGPCFHRARAALQAAKEDDGWLEVRGFGDRFDDRFNALVGLVQAIREDWTDRQREFAVALREHGGVQRRVAEAYDVSPSVVSESLSAAHVHRLRRAEQALRAMLNKRTAKHVEGSP